VPFTRTSDLVEKLQLAPREFELEAAIQRLYRYHLLILDDLVYVAKDQTETSVFRVGQRSLRTPLGSHHGESAVR
jgi:DNA replication protein DnaC